MSAILIVEGFNVIGTSDSEPQISQQSMSL